MIENAGMMRPHLRRSTGSATVPAEAWDRSHPDHSHWVGDRGWCWDADCERHTYGPETQRVTNEDHSLPIPRADTPIRSQCVTGE
jgi:hypothetical protein